MTRILTTGTLGWTARIFVSPLVAMHFIKTLNMHNASLYLAAALPVHLAIHFTIIGDASQLIGVSHNLLYFLSLP